MSSVETLCEAFANGWSVLAYCGRESTRVRFQGRG